MDIFDKIPLLPKLPEANCRNLDPDLFFYDSKKEEASKLEAAKIICGTCMNKQECLDFAISEKIAFGIWAGTTPEQREPHWAPEERTPGVPKVADRIRKYYKTGRTAKEIAEILNCDKSYVHKVLSRDDEYYEVKLN